MPRVAIEGTASKEVRDATATYRTSEDILQAFIDEACVVGPNERVQSSTFHRAFDRFCRESGEHTISNRKLTGKMVDRGFAKEKVGVVYLVGVGLQEVDVPEDWNESDN